MNIQDQIWVIAGVSGFIFLVFLILICVLFSWISKLKRQINGGGDYAGGGGRSGDVLEKRGFSEYKGAPLVQMQSPITPTPAPVPGALSRQTSNVGYSSYQQQAPSSAVKAPTPAPSYGNPHGHGGAGYGKGYDNSAYEEREQHRDVTAGGVRVLPSTSALDQQHIRRNNYENSGYY